MHVIRADKSGFCFGVKRAIEMARQQCETGKRVYSLGPLIHNPQVIERLREDGLTVIDSPDEAEGGTVVIRSHGAPTSLIAELRARGLEVVDATCPLVKRAQERAVALARDGYAVVIVGDPRHPEVRAMLADVGEATVVEEEPPATLASAKRVGVIAQTTQAPESFRHVVHRLLDFDFDELRVYNTICQATVDRQRAALDLAGSGDVDVMFVLGGRNSANTGRLAQL
ncbi:MAG TPA: 4-hydroxy-3-methylbut-2-enyl diphosphate reductase, partial [Planctomycetota bacterium]|nr:4-hydroxy-3-methylbut-2-enyl diphosphate reductase [Planctomycetota bacterium]